MPSTPQAAAQFLLNPLFPAFFLLLVFFLKRQRTRFGMLVLLVYLYIVSVPVTSKMVMDRWWVPDTVDYGKQYEAAVVLGGIVDYKWYVRHANSADRMMLDQLSCYHHFGESADRILMGGAVVKKGLAPILLLSDVTVRGVHETKLLVDFLHKQGVEDEKIVVHGRPSNTLAEAKNVKEYVAQHGLKKIILITSANHMRRAAAFFRKQGLEPALLSVSRDMSPITWESFVPSSDGLEDTYLMLYELVGYASYAFLGKL
ncbi:YdcF family protein [Thiovibrio sp. JS02]